MQNRFPPRRRTSLLGRAEECARLDALVGDVRQGESRSLVLRGEAGIGKTALLEYLVESASDLALVRAAGVESEMELAYASLHQLCAPMLDRLASLPAPQRQALEIVFGLSSGPAPDRFLVGLAVLSLLSEASAAELAGGFGLPDAMPLSSRIEESFVRRVKPLPEDTRRLLLLAAAEPVGDPLLLWRAAERLGIDPTAASAAEADELLAIDER